MEHCHVRRGLVYFMGDCVATSFFHLVAFNMSYDRWLRHHLVGIPCKVCCRGCVSLLYPHQPGNTSVPFGCILRATLHDMIDINTLYCILYMFGFLMSTMQFWCSFVRVSGVVLPLCCVFAASCVWFRVSCSIFVDILFYIHSICMFLRGCVIFGRVELCFSPL
jgi:hypothetical protein